MNTQEYEHFKELWKPVNFTIRYDDLKKVASYFRSLGFYLYTGSSTSVHLCADTGEIEILKFLGE